MDCSSCGHLNPDHAKFCLDCGAAFSRGCTRCGTELPAGARFCLECGAQAVSDEAGTSVASERAPRDYTPKHLADKILQSKSALEGERKQVTVLFADVKGSMELAEALGAEPWHGVLDRFFQILADGVHRFEGTINQYTGDGIMALFGAPISHEDHANRAGYSALHLRDELREFTREVKRRHGVDFAVRIGIHSGEVVVGKIGDDLRMDYTAQGHTVGLAQRLEALASGGCIYLSAATAALVGSYFELEDLGEFDVKGASEPLRVFELSGLGSARTRLDVSRARGLTRFVGRADETALLETALEQGLAGPGRTIGVSAQAGTGKSRLCYEFLEACRSRGLSVLEARGLAHGRQIPLLPVLELLQNFFGIEERDGDRMVREKIAGRILLLDASLEPELPIFFDLLGVPDPARPLPDIDPDALQRRMYAAIRAIVHADCELDPGIILIEDLHWLDPTSDALIEQLVEAVAGTRSLVIVNFRPEYRARWMQQSYYQQISLLPLSEEALRELLRDLLGPDPSVTGLPEAIHARTGGNPFFIEEVVQSLVEDGHLEGQRGSYRLVTEVQQLPVPESVQSILAARIDRLVEREKHLLQTASVIGKTFAETVLREVSDLPDTELSDALRNLQDAEFVYEAALYPEHEYSFKHPLTQEVAEQSQLEERRAKAHAAVARAYEELDPDHLDERAALLAHHWEGAGELERAARWHARAAGRISTTDYRESVAHWHRVDELLETAGPNPETDDLRGQSYRELLIRGFRTGLSEDEAASLFERGKSFHGTRGDEGSLAELMNGYAAILQSAGRVVEYREISVQASAIARRVGDPALRASIGLDRVYSLHCHGDLVGSVAAADEIIALAGTDLELGAESAGYSPLMMCTAFAVMPLVAMGRIAEAEERVQRARRWTGEGTPPETLAWIELTQLEIDFARGDMRAALRTARSCRAHSQRSGSTFDDVASRCWLATAHVEVGDFETAVSELEAGVAEAAQKRVARDIVIGTNWALPAAYLGLGDIARARRLADEAVATCTENETRVHLARAHLVRAAICRADPESSEADSRADLDAAEALIRETGARRYLGSVLEGRGQLREALDLYEEIGASGHAQRVAQLLAS